MNKLSSDKLRGSSTHQDQVECTEFPLLHGFLSILRHVVLDFLLLHERRQDRLVDRVVCTHTTRASSAPRPGPPPSHAPSTMSTLIGGTMLFSAARPPFLPPVPPDAPPELSAVVRFVCCRRVPGAPAAVRDCGESGGLCRGSWLVLLVSLGAAGEGACSAVDGETAVAVAACSGSSDTLSAIEGARALPLAAAEGIPESCAASGGAISCWGLRRGTSTGCKKASPRRDSSPSDGRRFEFPRGRPDACSAAE